MGVGEDTTPAVPAHLPGQDVQLLYDCWQLLENLDANYEIASGSKAAKLLERLRARFT